MSGSGIAAMSLVPVDPLGVLASAHITVIPNVAQMAPSSDVEQLV